MSLHPRRTHSLWAPALLLLAASLVWLPAAASAVSPELVPAEDGPSGRALHQWTPAESYVGRSQADPRLNQPVRFWRAGLALGDAFSSMAEQTGVKLDFWPPEDENTRVRVNLYLNPDEPPALRSLMAQLVWVTDCVFAYAEADAGDAGPTYYLLGTSIGRGIPRDLHLLDQAAREERRTRQLADVERDAQEVAANLEKLRSALQLSREQAIARYKGTDDYLLLTLLYPPRRAAAEYVCGATEPGSPLFGAMRSWDQLSEGERALAREAFLQFDSEDWPSKAEVQVSHMGPPNRQDAILVELMAKLAEDGEGNTTWGLVGPPCLIAPTLDAALGELENSPFEYAKALGQEISKDDREGYLKQWQASLSRKRHEWKVAASASSGALSPEMQDRLLSIPFSVQQGRPHALWEVQQLVAATSGLDVVSDCFSQPRRTLDDADSALYALALSCRAFDERARESQDPAWLAAWEWGDAGPFLRFRSTDRGLWRASLLLPETVAEVDAWLAPYLPDIPEDGLPPEGLSLRFLSDLPELFRVAGTLDDVQLAYGGRLIYDDPTDPTAACRQALRHAFLDVDDRGTLAVHEGASSLSFFRLVASLTDAQCGPIRGEGLNCSKLSEEQLRRLRGCPSMDEDRATDPSRLVLRAQGDLPTAPPGSSRASLPPMAWTKVQPGHYHQVAGVGADPSARRSFSVTLAHAEGEIESLLPEGETEREMSSIASWTRDYQIQVHVPGPPQPAAEKAGPG